MRTIALVFLLSVTVVEANPVVRILQDPKAAEDLFGMLIDMENVIAEKELENELDEKLKAMLPKLEEVLEWTGHTGYLIEVRAYVDVNGDIREYSSPQLCGSGNTPVDALVACRAEPSIRPGNPQGLRFSKTDSQFVWAYRPRGFLSFLKPNVEYGVIPHPLNADLSHKAAQITLADDVREEILNLRRETVFKNAVEHANDVMTEAGARALLSKTVSTLHAQRLELGEVEKKLAESRERLVKAQALRNQIKLFRGVLQFAQTVGDLQSRIGEISNFESERVFQSNYDVERWLSKYEVNMNAKIHELTTSIKRLEHGQTSSLKELYRSLEEQNAPIEILNELH